MSLKLQESISSFVDNELDASACDELLLHIDENEEQKKRLLRYGIISHAIKRDLSNNVHHDFLAGVQAGLMDDAPLKKNEPDAKVVPLPQKRSSQRSFRPVIGFGIAATMTLVAVLGFQMSTNTNDLPQEPMVASRDVPATQHIQIVTQPPVVAVNSATLEIDDLPSVTGNITYAEQSIIDDGQWTRITQLGNAPPPQRYTLSSGGERPVQYKNFPFARSVNLENASFK